MRINAAALKAIREAQGWQAKDLAAAAGISFQYLSNLERGVKGGSPATIKALALALKVPTAAITREPEVVA